MQLPETPANRITSPGSAFPMTTHAPERARQRGIDISIFECLLRHGREEHDHRGAVVVVIDRNAVERVRWFEDAATSRAAEDAREVYAVVGSEGQVLTTGHRFRRVARDLSLSNLRPRQRQN